MQIQIVVLSDFQILRSLVSKVLESETRDHKDRSVDRRPLKLAFSPEMAWSSALSSCFQAKLAPMESRINDVELVEKNTKVRAGWS